MGIRPLPGHVQAVVQFPRPSTRLELQHFLGLINFFRRFLRGMAGLLLPLTDALKGPGKSLAWSPPMEQAFKTALAAATGLKHPQANFPISLMVYASYTHFRAVLKHFRRSSWAPLSLFSKKLTPAETDYSTFERELLAVYAAIRHFWLMLEGREFFVLIDHKPSTFPVLQHRLWQRISVSTCCMCCSTSSRPVWTALFYIQSFAAPPSTLFMPSLILVSAAPAGCFLQDFCGRG